MGYKSLQGQIASVAHKWPDKIAIEFGDSKITYLQLELEANKIACFFENKLGGTKNVFIMMNRQPALVYSLLGIIKGGGVFVPIDPSLTENRLKSMLKEVEAQWVIADESALIKMNEIMKGMGRSINVLVMGSDKISDDEYSNLHIHFTDESMVVDSLHIKDEIRNKQCYIYFTSGSTGKPKAILGRHRSLKHFIDWEIKEFGIDETCKVSQFTTLSFDPSLRDIFVPLCAGGTLCIPEYIDIILDAGSMAKWISTSKISLMHMVPSLFKILLEELNNSSDLEELKYILLAGEMVRGSDVKKFYEIFGNTVTLINLYGPTETTLAKAFYIINEHDVLKTSIPIGKPIDSTEIMILDKDLDKCEAGSIGEIYIRTPFISSGYYNNLEVTKTVFIRNPFSDNPQDIIYRTGDLGRFLSDGNIECLGRIDNQVKIRGIRIEPGEIENLLLSYKNIKSVVVIAKEDDKHDKYLCAYFVGDNKLAIQDVRIYLSKHLPDYMIPSYFVQLDKLPLTPNGKLDRNALPEPDRSISSGVEYEAPINEMEEKLAVIWQEVLGVKMVGRNDNFFELGGHSLKATVLLSRIHKKMNVEIPLREAFANPEFKHMAEYIKEATGSIYKSIEPVGIKEYYPLSSAQKRLYILNQIERESLAYNMPGTLVLEGKLDKERLEKAFRTLIVRHETLRTSFETVEGEPVQKISEEVEFEIEYYELEEEKVAEKIKELIRPFDLSKAPLLRAALIKIKEDKYIMLFDMHHIISDGMTMNIITKEFAQVYEGKELPELRIQYKDYSEWQNRLFETGIIEKQKENWLNVFEGEIPLLNLPTDYTRPSLQSFEGDHITFHTGEETKQKINQLIRETGTTTYMLLLAAYNTLLMKYTGQEDIVVGSPIAGRHHADLENMIGMFVNTLAMRNQPAGNKTFKEFLYEVKENTLKAYENQDYQFEELVENLEVRRDISRNPLFDVVFVLQNTGNVSVELQDLRIKPYHIEKKVSKFDLTLNAVEGEDTIYFNLEYCTKLFKKETIERMGEHFGNILEEVLSDPDTRLCDIEMLSEEEKQQILYDFNNTKAEYPKDKTIHQLFEEQAAKTPDNIALVFEDKQLTYRELNEKSNQLARLLRKKGVKPDSIVGIMVERSPEMIIGIMGILKAGGAYLPIDPEYPSDRITFMLEDSCATVLLSQKNNKYDVEFKGEVLYLDEENTYSEDGSDLELVNQPKDIAYIIYTSGTTGRPKGAMIEHRNVVRLMFNNRMQFDFNENDIWTMFHSYCFDFSVWEMYGALLYGGRLVIIPRIVARDTCEYLKLLRKEEVTVLNQTPTAFYNLSNEEEKQEIHDLKIRYVIFGGEALRPSMLRYWYEKYPDVKLINMYGITETTVHVTYKEIGIDEIDKDVSNIGKPIPTLTAYVMDRNRKLLPIGVVGELCVGGDGLGRGYLNRPELTSEKFVINPYTGERMYRSGDLVRFLPNGEMEYSGRLDQQVKIRGHRIELGEIEATLLKHEQVKEAVVTAKKEEKGTNYLCAYLVSNEELQVSELRNHISKELPDYMIPSYFVHLDKLPLTPNGKLDRKALPEPNGSISTGVEYEAPTNETEEKLVSIWKEVLGAEKIGRNDNFFELGGHSLKATVLVSRIHKEMNVEVPLREAFANPVLKSMAEYIKETTTSIYKSIEPVGKKEYYPLSSAQKRLYILNQMEKENLAYNMPGTLVLEGKLDKERLEKAFGTLIGRHETLRTSFELVEGEPVQKISEMVEFEIEYYELEKEKAAEKIKELIRPFDLSKAPLLRAALIKTKEERHILLFDMHHIISDGMTMNIITKEFAQVYEGRELPELRIQYKDYSEWQNRLFETGIIEKQKESWLKVFEGEIPLLNLPTDYTRPSRQSFEGDHIAFHAGKEIKQKIHKLIQETGTTMYMVLLAAYNTLLMKYAGQEDIVVGTPIAGRPHADLESMVGMFVNTLAMRNQPAQSKTFRDFLKEVKENTLKAYENQDYQFEELIENLEIKRDMSRNPLFDVMLVLQNTGNVSVELQGLRIKPYQTEKKVSKFDLTLNAVEGEDTVYFNLEYCTRLFKKETIERMGEHFGNILEEVLSDPDTRLCDIEMLSEEEKQQILCDFNNTKAEYPKGKTIHQLFEEQAAKTPDNIALVFEDKQLTYRELNEKSNQLARLLRKKGVKPDSIVGIMVERSPEMIIGIMGVLKAGGAYLPIDPEYPSDRIRYMLEDSNAKILLVRNKDTNILREENQGGFQLEVIDIYQESVYKSDNSNVKPVNNSKDLAYVIYTSGSTGKPKGVMLEHRSVNNFIKGMTEKIEFLESKTILALTTISFDIFVLETILPLTRGMKIVIADEKAQKDPEAIGRLISENEIDMLQTTPSRMKMIIGDGEKTGYLNTLKEIMVGGEAFPEDLLENLRKLGSTRIYNMYGPTETTVWSAVKEVTKCKKITLGTPIVNTQVYILDSGKNIQPIGVAGELCISGDGLARGYLNRPELTAEKFVPNPYIPGERMYRTGDLARWLPDKNMEFLGRIDHQVKIRGFRIELGEIENHLSQHEMIKEAIVVEKEDLIGNKYLCAYYISEIILPVRDIRGHLSAQLPDYMLPSYFIQMDKFPMNSNGKLDKKALPEPEGNIVTTEEYKEPTNETEEELVSIWQEVLGIERVGIYDNFFELGGTSLSAMLIISRIQKRFDLKIKLIDFFSAPKIANLAAVIMVEKSDMNELYDILNEIESQ